VLAQELELWRLLPQAELLARIGLAPVCRTFQVVEEEIVIEIAADWAHPRRDAVRIGGVAYGPSHLRIERLEEGITVELSPAGK